ncbi:MAG: spermine/spermidine synthase domain-containing protein, partial [Planctomycetota bacterium]
MRFARGLLIFGYGLFTIAAQALLFREFVTTFEGNDISVGIFFGSWFLWVGLGAILVYRAETLAEKVLNYIEFLFLCYLPAFILQMLLIVQARPLAGIESYARIPMSAVLLLSLLVNAPVSLITGMLFPLACRWVRRERTVAVSSVYILEAAGSFVGGLGVTVMLAFGVTSARIFFVLAFIVTFSGLCVQLARKLDRRRGSAALVLYTLMTCALLCLVTRADKALAHYLPTVQWPGADTALMRSLRTEKWTRLLPRDAFQGSFQTAQAEYLYGLYRDQWVVVREGSACETLPDRESAGRVAAIALCQNPGAGKVLVVGSGLGLCHEFLHLPHIEDVTWTHPDDEYVQKVDRFLPPQFKISDPRFHKLAGDVRSLLAQKKRYYDLVILNLPDATSSVLNRYYTLEFYNQVKDSLASGGVLAVRVAGGENIMGTELINLGASTKLTLEKVFPQLVLAPGEETWFVASDSSDVTQDPGILRDRFASIPGAADIFPPDALLSVYLPDRAAFALDNYSQADLPQRLLINRDSRPLTHLYSLLLAAKQSGAPVTKLIKQLALAGWLVFLIPILVVAVLRISYILKTCEPEIPSSFDASFLVFSAGWTGIGVVIVLMYLYQTCLGSLYLHIGVISSLFMVGLTLGALLLSSLLIPHKRELPHAVLSAVVFGHSLVLLAIVFWPLDEWTQLAFGAAFVLCGFCSGCYFPIAARLLADSDFEPGPVGSKLETADHLGASAGSVLTSLALVPLLGTKAALLLFVLLMLANLPAAILSICKPAGDYSFAANGLSLRGLGYTLFGIGLSVVLCSNLLAAAAARLSISLPQYAAQALAGEAQIEQTVATSGD